MQTKKGNLNQIHANKKKQVTCWFLNQRRNTEEEEEEEEEPMRNKHTPFTTNDSSKTFPGMSHSEVITKLASLKITKK